MPEVVYGLRAAEVEWPIGKFLNHFKIAGEWFRYLLIGEEWTELPRITNSDVLLKMATYLGKLDNVLIAAASGPDAELTFKGEDGTEQKTKTSMVLSQAVMHSAEHKGQLATILKAHGYSLDLDKYVLWNFESTK